MKKVSLVVSAVAIASLVLLNVQLKKPITGAPPGGIPKEEVPDNLDPFFLKDNWVRPEGPAKVAIQVGHWQNESVPEELENLKKNGGASAGGINELDINLKIAQELKDVLESEGVVVEILPTTVPPRYLADIFISLHADGSQDTLKSGYKFAAPWRDFTGKAQSLVALLEEQYQQATKLEKDPNITANMRGYYAFSFWKFEHAIHPMTTAVIAETGFVTNKGDRQLLTSSSLPAQAISKALVIHLKNEGLLTTQ